MNVLIEEILAKKDDLFSYLITSGFNVDISSDKHAGYSIKKIIVELDALLKNTFLNLNRKGASLSIYFTSTEIEGLQTSLEAIKQHIDDCEKQISTADDNIHIFSPDTIQLNNDPFDMPNIKGDQRQKQLRPRISLHLKDVISEMDYIKPLLRPFVYKSSEARKDTLRKLTDDGIALEQLKTEFFQYLELSRNNQLECERVFNNIEKIYDQTVERKSLVVSESEEISDGIEKSKEKIDEITNTTADWREKLIAFESLKSEIETIHVSMDELYKSSSEIRKIFYKSVEKAEECIETASIATEYFDGKVKDVENLKIKADSILNLSGTVSLGKFFDDQYNESKKSVWLWLVACGVLLLSAVGACGWALWHFEKNFEILYLVSRLSVVPLILGGLWFCANQYIKQKHIIEDYAYKRVLALSMVSFRNEINDVSPEGVSEYIKSVLKQLHQPPLESLDKNNFKEEVRMLRGVRSELLKNIMDGVLSDKNRDGKEKQESVN